VTAGLNVHREGSDVASQTWPTSTPPHLLLDRHEELWQVQEPLDFPGTVYRVPRGTSMREVMRQQSEGYRLM
jgi:hypothetical protein